MRKIVSFLLLLSLIFTSSISTISLSLKDLFDNNEMNNESFETNIDNNMSIDEKYKTAINMLNYLTVVTQEIKKSKNRVLLDDKYNTLYEWMNLDAVDTETQGYIKQLADAIFNLKMSETKRERIEYLWEQERAGAIKSAIPNPLGLLSTVKSMNLLSLVSSGAYMLIDSVIGYNNAINNANMNYLKNGWEIEDKELSDINLLNKDLWDYKNNMRRDNSIPADYILNEPNIQKFVDWKNENNVDSRIRFFEENRNVYKGYPTYWLVLARCYYEKATENIDNNGDKTKANREYLNKCIDATKQYEINRAKIFIKDKDFAKMIPLVIASAETILSNSQYISTCEHYINLLEINADDEDWDLQYFIAQTYVDLYGKTNRKEYLEKAYDKAYNNVNHLARIQRKMNDEYLGDYVEEKVKAGATKEEEKRVKEYNKNRKEERKFEFPPILDSLEMNCQLLFSLAEKKNISDGEKNTIDSILHDKDKYLFLLAPLDDLYWFNNPDKELIDKYADEIKPGGSDSFEIPTKFICAKSNITATYDDGINKKKYDYWDYSIDRKTNMAYVTMRKYDENKDKKKI